MKTLYALYCTFQSMIPNSSLNIPQAICKDGGWVRYCSDDDNILLDVASVFLQFPWWVRRDSRADGHWICLLQLPQQRGHVPCVHKATFHRGGHPAGTVMQYQKNTPFMIHYKLSDRFPLGIVVPYFECTFLHPNNCSTYLHKNTLVVKTNHVKPMV